MVKKLRVYLPPITILIIAFAYLFLFFNKRINLLDEGLSLYASERILKGQVPYRDFFVMVTPGTFYFQALLFKIFGSSVILGRWIVLIEGALTTMLLYLVAKRVNSIIYAALGAILFLLWEFPQWMSTNYSWYGIILALLVILSLSAYLVKQNYHWLLLASILAGLTAFFKQNMGFFSALTIFLIIILRRIILAFRETNPPLAEETQFKGFLKEIGYLALGILIIFIPLIIYMVSKGALLVMFKDAVYYPTFLYKEGAALPFPELLPIRAESVLSYLPLITYPLTALIVIIRVILKLNTERDIELVMLAIFGSLFFLASFPRADFIHVSFGIMPLFILFPYLLNWIFDMLSTGLSWLFKAEEGAKLRIIQVVVVMLTLIGPAFLVRDGIVINQERYKWQQASISDVNRAGDIYLSHYDALKIRTIVSFIRENTKPEDPIFVVPWAVMFYFLTERDNPTRWDLIIPTSLFNLDEIIATLEEVKPRYVIWGYEWDVDGKKFEVYAQKLAKYIFDNYDTVEFTNKYEILERTSD